MLKTFTHLFCYAFFLSLFSLPIIAQCDVNEDEVMVEIITDNFPQEISWRLKADENIIASIAQGTYTIQGNTYQEIFCVPQNSCMTFAIYDSFGDGICCAYGEGSYNIYVNGNLLLAGDGDYDAGTMDSIPCSTTSCPLGQSEVVIEFRTDRYPLESSWFLAVDGVVYEELSQGTYTDTSTVYLDTICVPENTCIELNIADSYGDGICCAYGEGFYNVYLNGELTVEGDGIFTSTITNTIECDSPPELCPEGQEELMVEINTDNYPQEISWTLSANGTIIGEATQGTYALQGNTYQETLCVPQNACLEFSITDSFGDGICCGFGEGSYNLYLNGEILLAGNGDYGTGTIDSIACSTTSCPAGQSEIVIEFRTDKYPLESSWVLAANGTVYGEVLQGTYTDTSTIYLDTICVPENTCLELSLADSYGDGICCAYGLGFYNVYIDGDLVVEGDGNFLDGITMEIGCGIGESCNSGILVETYGVQTAPMSDSWYLFTPDSSGLFSINTCDLVNDCNTAIWIYDYCIGLDWDNSPEGGIYYGGGGCASNVNDALINAILTGGQTYYIRVGSEDSNCAAPIDWYINYEGPIAGCIDQSACNFDPNATVMEPNSCIYLGDPDCPNGPDLIVLEDVLQNSMYLQLNDNDDACYIEEGCVAGYGQRQLLRFTTQIENIGEQDFYIGAPPASPDLANDQWEWDPCHGHWHYEGYAEYVLYDENQQPLPIGFKNGFCVMDLSCAYGGGTPKYGCGNQGISSHCGDIYSSGLDCQWIDITDIPDASYTLVVRVNWDQSPDAAGRLENSFTNNWAQACIDISTTPAGIRNVDVDSNCNPYVDCAGEVFGDAVLDCEGNCGGVACQGDMTSDQQLTNEDLMPYLEEILHRNPIEPVSPCLDLDGQGTLTVADAILALVCSKQEGEANGGVDYCEFPYNVINIYDSVSIKLGVVNMEERYFEIEMSNPDGKVMGFQFSINGINIQSIQPIEEVFGETNFYFTHSENEILAISTDLNAINKKEGFYPVLRVYFDESLHIQTEVCIQKITAVINDLREKTISRFDETCRLITPELTGLEGISLPNLQVAPNPFSDFTIFDFGKNISGVLEIVEANGASIKRFDIQDQSSFKLNREGWNAGVYIYHLTGPNVNKSGKLIVK